MIYACQVDVGMSIGKWLSLSEKRGSVLPKSSISVTKRRNEVFINFDSISDIVYEKPSIFNYLTSTAGSSSYIFPGFLRINIKTTDGKRKAYFIRLKFKDFQRLPKKYIDLLKYPV
jgi:hypothetical protein